MRILGKYFRWSWDLRGKTQMWGKKAKNSNVKGEINSKANKKKGRKGLKLQKSSKKL